MLEFFDSGLFDSGLFVPTENFRDFKDKWDIRDKLGQKGQIGYWVIFFLSSFLIGKSGYPDGR
jgi:hypothetical protein